MATKTNSKPCQTSRMELLSKIKSRSLFLQKPLFWMLDKVLNMLLNWLPKLMMFHF